MIPPKALILLLAALIPASCGGKKFLNTKPGDVVIPQELEKTFEVHEYSGMPGPAVPEQEVTVPAEANKKMAITKNVAKKDKEKPAAKPVEAARAQPGGFVIPNRRPHPDPVWIGEKIVMDVTWLKTRAGEFTLEVLPFKEINHRKVYNLRGTARTADFFAFVYKAEDIIESFVDYEGWFPYKFTLTGNESRYIRKYLELFDHHAKRQYVHTMNQKLKTGEVSEEKGYKELTPLAQDSISALYFARTQKLEPGTTIRFPMTTNGTVWETEVVVLGREELSTPMGKLPAIKARVQTKFRGVLQQKGDSFIWFSDDARHFPLKFEAKVKIGWVTGIAKKIENGAGPG
ncbi:MAG: DUF3108 domain-containing protein [Deltaproteobacteria bacterium]|nr:DUF3108 domain-containing protein [Deltaproteobacteria bacterium]